MVTNTALLLGKATTPVGTTMSPPNPGMVRLSCAAAEPILPDESGNSVSVAVVVPDATYKKVPAAFTASAAGASASVTLSCFASVPSDASVKCTTVLLSALAT
jgi:hypothetical protein